MLKAPERKKKAIVYYSLQWDLKSRKLKTIVLDGRFQWQILNLKKIRNKCGGVNADYCINSFKRE